MESVPTQIETLRKRVEAGGAAAYYDQDRYDGQTIAEEDRPLLLAFSEELQLRRAEYSDKRHLKLLSHCVRLAESAGPLAPALENEDRAKEIVNWIHSEYENEETNKDFRIALRRFGKILADANGHVPESVELSDKGIPRPLDWINSTTSSTYDPAPDPGKMLKWDADVKPMLEEANDRDAAAIALQFDAGLRGGEYASLTVGSISEHRHGLQVTVQGKQGQRSITLIPSGPYIERWLAVHPAGDDPDAPLWTKVNAPQELSRKYKNLMLKKPAERAGVDKPVTPTNFRKSSASWAASRGMSQAHLENRYGWVRGSKVASRYVTVFSEDTDREYARLHGKDVREEEPEDRSPLECPKCGNETPRHKDLCVWCGQALEPGAAEIADEMEEQLVDLMADAETEEEREGYKKAWLKMRKDPERRAEMVDDLAEEWAGD